MVYINNCFFLNQFCDNMHKAWSKLICFGHKMESWVLKQSCRISVFVERKGLKICEILQTALPFTTSSKVYLSPVLYK